MRNGGLTTVKRASGPAARQRRARSGRHLRHRRARRRRPWRATMGPRHRALLARRKYPPRPRPLSRKRGEAEADKRCWRVAGRVRRRSARRSASAGRRCAGGARRGHRHRRCHGCRRRATPPRSRRQLRSRRPRGHRRRRVATDWRSTAHDRKIERCLADVTERVSPAHAETERLLRRNRETEPHVRDLTTSGATR